jgi:lipoprotein-releasing system permease protein
VISVLQKSRQIGILKAMGIKDKAASMIFLYQGFLLGIVGSTLGILLGLGLLYSFYYFNVTPEGKPLVELYVGFDFIILYAILIYFIHVVFYKKIEILYLFTTYIYASCLSNIHQYD